MGLSQPPFYHGGAAGGKRGIAENIHKRAVLGRFDGGGAWAHIWAMAILKIARMGHPILSRPALAVADPAAPEIRRLVEDMIDTMYDAPGIGLAAPQVHVPLRIMVFYLPQHRADPGDNAVPLTVLINPEWRALDDEIAYQWEGCLSVPGLRGRVPRAARIQYWGYGLDGQRIEREARGKHAGVFQHEFDHLEGRLYPARMNDLGDLIFESEFKYRENPALAQALWAKAAGEPEPQEA